MLNNVFYTPEDIQDGRYMIGLISLGMSFPEAERTRHANRFLGMMKERQGQAELKQNG